MGLLLFVGGVLLAACTHDFDAFDNAADASADGASSGNVPPNPNPNPSPNPNPPPPGTPPPPPPVGDAGKDANDAGGCGSVQCVNAGGSCSAVCSQCASKCTDPRRPICCALPGNQTSCQRRPQDC